MYNALSVYRVGMTSNQTPSVGLRELRTKIGHIVEQALFYRAPTVIDRYGKPAAVVVSYDWWLEQQQSAADSSQ